MKYFKATLQIFLICMMFIISSKAWSATFYVSKTGHNADPGTLTKPFKTIAYGSQKLRAGDTLYIRAGTYAESMNHDEREFRFTNGRAGAYTRYIAYRGEQVIIMPNSNGLAIVPETAAYIEIRGFIFDGTNASGGGVILQANTDFSVHAHHVRIINNDIRNSDRSALQAVGNNEIIGNRLHGAYSYGCYCNGDGGLFERNIIYGNGGYGLHLYNEHNFARNWVIRNNTFYNNGSGFHHSDAQGRPRRGPWQETAAVILTRGANNQFYNNLLYSNPHGGVRVWGNADNALIANNTIYGNGDYGIKVDGAINENNRIVNNVLWKNSGPQIQDLGTGTVIQNNLTTDPKFVDANGRNFRLRPYSPAINRGVTLTQVLTDFLGVLRPRGGSDIGAYEFVSGLLPRPPSGLVVLSGD